MLTLSTFTKVRGIGWYLPKSDFPLKAYGFPKSFPLLGWTGLEEPNSDQRISSSSVDRTRLRERVSILVCSRIRLSVELCFGLTIFSLRLAPSDQLRTGTDKGNPTV